MTDVTTTAPVRSRADVFFAVLTIVAGVTAAIVLLGMAVGYGDSQFRDRNPRSQAEQVFAAQPLTRVSLPVHTTAMRDYWTIVPEEGAGLCVWQVRDPDEHELQGGAGTSGDDVMVTVASNQLLYAKGCGTWH